MSDDKIFDAALRKSVTFVEDPELATLRAQLAAAEEQLKTVLERESATIIRYDEKISDLTAEVAVLVGALERADKLINWMMNYVGKMAPGDYHNCYADLNEHCLFMERSANTSEAAKAMLDEREKTATLLAKIAAIDLPFDEIDAALSRLRAGRCA